MEGTGSGSYPVAVSVLVYLQVSLKIIRQIKSRRMRWARHVPHMGEERKVCKVLVGKPERKTLKTKA
jgi:hypothetical protein